MTIAVIDASVAIKWFFTEEDGEPYTAEAYSLLSRIVSGNLKAIVPVLFFSECANVLWKACRLRGFPNEAATEALNNLLLINLEVFNDKEFIDIALKLSIKHNRPVYDCLYLAIAEVSSLDLITADEKFYNALKGLYKNIKWIRE
ncbi:MAG: type II toxin-antitoxin system VapC family toxin [Nitrospirae bacterium]|nr:type II toxin-antitoxin system VapC family toxin [Nitrospirota bacterium]